MFKACCYLVLVVAILVGGAVLYKLGYRFYDVAGLEPTNMATVHVLSKEVIPPHLTPMMIGKVVVLKPNRESVRLFFQLEDAVVSVRVDEINPVFSAQVGDLLKVGYGHGRLSNICMPVWVRLLN